MLPESAEYKNLPVIRTGSYIRFFVPNIRTGSYIYPKFSYVSHAIHTCNLLAEKPIFDTKLEFYIVFPTNTCLFMHRQLLLCIIVVALCEFCSRTCMDRLLYKTAYSENKNRFLYWNKSSSKKTLFRV